MKAATFQFTPPFSGADAKRVAERVSHVLGRSLKDTFKEDVPFVLKRSLRRAKAPVNWVQQGRQYVREHGLKASLKVSSEQLNAVRADLADLPTRLNRARDYASTHFKADLKANPQNALHYLMSLASLSTGFYLGQAAPDFYVKYPRTPGRTKRDPAGAELLHSVLMSTALLLMGRFLMRVAEHATEEFPEDSKEADFFRAFKSQITLATAGSVMGASFHMFRRNPREGLRSLASGAPLINDDAWRFFNGLLAILQGQDIETFAEVVS